MSEPLLPNQQQSNLYSSNSYGESNHASPSGYTTTDFSRLREHSNSSMDHELAQADSRRADHQRHGKNTSWGSYNQFVTAEPGPSTPGGGATLMTNPYDSPSYDHTPAGSPTPSPYTGPARGHEYNYRPARQASREADIADGIRPQYDVPEPEEERLSWHSKGGNKLRRVKHKMQYDEEGKPRREKKDKYGVKEIPEGWTAEDEEAEREFLASSMFNWQELMTWRFWIRKEWWCKLLVTCDTAKLTGQIGMSPRSSLPCSSSS